MSPPRCGLTTVVVPLSTWSPVNSARSSSRKKHRWFGAWPGVCIASSRNSVPSIVSPSASTRSSSRSTSSAFGELAERGDERAGLLADPLRRGPVVGMRVREQHPAHAVAHRRADDRVDVLVDVGTGIDHRDLVDADEIRVRARARHEARIRRDHAAGRAATARSAHRGSGEARAATVPRPSRMPPPAAMRARRGCRDVGERDRPPSCRAASSPGSTTRSPPASRDDERAALVVARHAVEVGEERRRAGRSARAPARLARSGRSGRCRRVRAVRERVDRADPRRTRRARCRRARRLRRRARARRRTTCRSGGARRAA